MIESETREQLDQIIKRDVPGYELWNKQPITEKIVRIVSEPSVEELKQKYFGNENQNLAAPPTELQPTCE